MIMIDSCMYIDWMKQGINPVERLAPRHTEMISCGIIDLEVIRGITHPAVKQYLIDYFDILPQVPLSNGILQSATELAWNLDRKEIVLPSTDLIIAACVLKAGATIITRDQHFSRIPGIQVSEDL
ncbi:MAG: PIN domain-containing protein [Verrucomicrobia bacterium]|nr:PIN domain-containing protein [Verrucomicrobiota bacterium]